jgi:hypothetical protein
MGPERLLIGIDFSKSRSDLALLKSNGQILKAHKAFANSRAGYDQAKELILKTIQEHNLDGLDVAGEATSYYWLPMFIHFEQDADLAAYSPSLYLLNPKWVHWYKKAQPKDHKNDQSDPRYIGDYLRVHRPTTSWHYDDRWVPVRILTRLRSHLVKTVTREKNLLSLYIFLDYATYTDRKPFSKPLSGISQTLLKDPTLLESFADDDLENLVELLQEQSNYSLKDPLESAQRLRQVMQERYKLPDKLGTSIQYGIDILLDTINALQSQIKRVETEVMEMTREGYPEIAWLDSIPGVGQVLASGIASEIGEISRFLDHQVWDDHSQSYRSRRSSEVTDAISKYAGLWWPDNSSGNFQAEDKRLSREGNSYLRFYILEAADCMRRSLPVFARYYQSKADQATHHKHKRALVLTGSKALDLFVTLLRKGESYRAKENAT